jgi:glycosyltransferase involved in cell wall biosynthesis
LGAMAGEEGVARAEDAADLEASIGSATAEGRAPKVLQVLPRLITGGLERGAVDVAIAQVEAGFVAYVASEGGRMEHELTRGGARHVRMPLASKNPLVIWRNAAMLAALIEREGVDIVHARSRAPGWSALLAARRTGRPLVTTFHGTYSASNVFRRRYNAVMAAGDRVIAISHFIAVHLRKVYGVPSSRIRIIHRGVDLDRFDPAKVSDERVIALATKWRLPDGVPVVLLPGRVTRRKGHEHLIRALHRIKNLEFVCLMVGDSSGREDYVTDMQALARECGLADRVAFTGHCDDMPAVYMLSDVAVCCAIDPEAFGRTVGEAQAMGRPVVLYDHGGAPEQVLGDRTAFPVPPGDVPSLAAGLRRALELTPAEREVLAGEAIAHTRANFSKVQMCHNTLSVYYEVLAECRERDQRLASLSAAS